MAYSTTIGDSQEKAVQPVVAALPISIISQAQLEDASDPVNITLYSGKTAGAAYVIALTAGGTDIVVAQGPEPTDDWDRISDAGASPITPA